MGMCAITGPCVLHEDVDVDEAMSMRSTSSSNASSSASCTLESYGSATSLELDVIEAADPLSSNGDAIWQRTIPKGRRCKPLSFSGMIQYDESGNLVKFLQPEDLDFLEEDDEYFSPQRNLAEREREFIISSIE